MENRKGKKKSLQSNSLLTFKEAMYWVSSLVSGNTRAGVCFTLRHDPFPEEQGLRAGQGPQYYCGGEAEIKAQSYWAEEGDREHSSWDVSPSREGSLWLL